MFYTRDENAIRNVLRSCIEEMHKTEDCSQLMQLNEKLPLVGLRALFILLIVTDPRLRYWAMQYETRTLTKPKPEKVCRFLKTLRDDIIPAWQSDERQTAQQLVREATITYIRC